MGEKHVRIIWAVVLIGVCAFLLLSYLSYDPLDISYLTSHPNEHLRNQGGRVGAYLVFGLLTAVGWSAYFIPVLFTFWAAGKLMEKTSTPVLSRLFGFLFVIWSFSSMMSTLTNAYDISRVATGGILGFYTSTHLMRYFGEVGTLIILGTIFFLSLLLATEFLVVPFFLQIARLAVRLVVAAKPKFSLAAKPRLRERPVTVVRRIKPERRLSPELRPGRLEESRSPDGGGEAGSADSPGERAVDMAKEAAARFFKPKLVVKKPKPSRVVKPTEKQPPSAPKFVGDYKLPSLDLLVTPPPLEDRVIKDDLEGNSKILEETLRDFGIEAKVVEVEQGPVITMYELQPAPGVKITKITSLGDDIALSMKAPSVHIVAPMPGKGTVGIQVPNIQASLVYLKELLETPEFQNAKSKLTMAMGKDVSGNPLVSDLADMPHFLIAGTTGSGKTVCVNSLIMSFIFQASPEEVKLILIDPKMVEMSMYNGLPHLVCPVITDIKKAAGALDWAVNEMEERYRLLAKVGARNILGFNKKLNEGLTEIEDGEQKITLEHMPYIVIIIDELADMMLLAAKEVETSITRLAQLSRGVGIHLILATQRPSVDVITGVIKANFPARISFRVASKVDSRTVLDANGAEKLLGKGDMLFMKPGNFKLIRAQASLVSDKEIDDVVNFAKAQRAAVYSDAVTKEHDKVLNFSKGKDGARDELFEEAAKLVITTRQASVSILQRRLRLGYARAARLIDMMEEEGIIGGFRGSKAREILVESWDDVAFAREQPSGTPADAGQ